jgi:hypothetical protein
MKPVKSELELGREHAARIERASSGRDLSNLDVAVVWTHQLAYAHKVRTVLINIGCRSVRLERGGPWHLPPMGVYVCVQDRSNASPDAYVLLEILKGADILDSSELERFPSGKPGIVYVLVVKAA